MKTVSLKVPESLDAALESFAKRTGKSKSAIARDAFQAFFKKGPGKKKSSAHDLAKDLIGKFTGAPADLSTNKKYMRGYGR